MKHYLLSILCALSIAPGARCALASLTLANGDAVTINGTGTTGTIGGILISNSTSSYLSGLDQNGIPQTEAITLLAGNEQLTIGPGALLKAAILANGADAISSLSSGTIRITGGTLTGGPAVGGSGAALSAKGTGPIFISGGDFTGGISGGIGLENGGSGPIWISGGNFTGQGNGGQAITALRHFNTVTSQNEPGGVVSITGGHFADYATGYGLVAEPLGTIALFSQGDTPFLINGVPMNHLTLPLMPGKNTISGTLYNGDLLNTSFYNSDGANSHIELNVGSVPEPATMSLFILCVPAILGRRGRRATVSGTGKNAR